MTYEFDARVNPREWPTSWTHENNKQGPRHLLDWAHSLQSAVIDYISTTRFRNTLFQFSHTWSNFKKLNIHTLNNTLYIRFLKTAMRYVYLFIHFFYVGFILRTFTNHRISGEGGGHFFNSSLPHPLPHRLLRRAHVYT